jgi:DNA-binding response OmpR family regulator
MFFHSILYVQLLFEEVFMARKRKKRILLVEDDFYILDIYQTKLSQEGYKVMIAEDGEVALETIKREKGKIDLVVLDISMPHMNGLEFMRSVRKELKRDDVPFIVLTNLVKQSLVDEFEAMGSLDYLVKANYTPRQVMAKIKSYLEQGEAA